MDVEKLVRQNIEPLVHMSLATVSQQAPWVCEVHYAYDQDLNLYFMSLPTRRHCQEIAANPSVAGNIVKQHELGEPVVGVYFEGKAKMLHEGEELNTAIRAMKDHLNAQPSMLEELTQPDGGRIYKINVDNYYVFGKFDQPKGIKYKLEWNGGEK